MVLVMKIAKQNSSSKGMNIVLKVLYLKLFYCKALFLASMLLESTIKEKDRKKIVIVYLSTNN